jgi:hypothetical protein
MRLLILDGLIAGLAGDDMDSANLPSGFTILEYPEQVPVDYIC